MIAIIAEKPTVGKDIAQVIGATEKHNGYMQGNGYIVTWALGHLVGLALPEFYGRKRGATELPIIPNPFCLVKRTKKVNGKLVTDGVATKQIMVIRRVFDQCQSIIVATDAGREGEAIFRYIYEFLECKLPFQRLWISSLTDETIDEGLRNLKEGKLYDGLYRAAECRAKADWLVGMNASAALAKASGIANSSLGRVQTPTLAMIASRYLENRGFLPTDYWQLSITVGKGDALRKFRYVEDIKTQSQAESVFAKIKAYPQAKISKVEKKITHEQPPLLYDLTALQKDCNVHFDMTAEKTLDVAQSLYEKKLISYPRTGSRYISPDMMRHIPSLLRMILRIEQFSHFADSIDPLCPSQRSVDAAKVTDHHALIITGDYARDLTPTEDKVYHMIAGRMLEAFGPRCEKEIVVVEAVCDGMTFRSRSTEILSAGWRGVYNRPEQPGDDEDDIRSGNVDFAEGEAVPVSGHSISKKQTIPKPLYTEATLLSAMENCGKHVEDEKAREAMKENGIGTPATRAAIIEMLIVRDYIERSGKSLVPTERGLHVYQAIKDMRIADVELTGSWEASLRAIERGDMTPDTFMKAITVYTRQLTKEVLSLDIKQPDVESFACPKCRQGNVQIRHKLAKCDNDCGFVVFRKFLNKQLTDTQIQGLLKSGRSPLIKGFSGKNGTFEARLKFDEHFNLRYDFPAKRKSDPKTGSPTKTGSKSKTASGAKPTSGSKTKPSKK